MSRQRQALQIPKLAPLFLHSEDIPGRRWQTKELQFDDDAEKIQRDASETMATSQRGTDRFLRSSWLSGC